MYKMRTHYMQLRTVCGVKDHVCEVGEYIIRTVRRVYMPMCAQSLYAHWSLLGDWEVSYLISPPTVVIASAAPQRATVWLSLGAATCVATAAPTSVATGAATCVATSVATSVDTGAATCVATAAATSVATGAATGPGTSECRH